MSCNERLQLVAQCIDIVARVPGLGHPVGDRPGGERKEPLAHRGRHAGAVHPPLSRPVRPERVAAAEPHLGADRFHGEGEEVGGRADQLVGALQMLLGFVLPPLPRRQTGGGEAHLNVDEGSRIRGGRFAQSLRARLPMAGCQPGSGFIGRDPRDVRVGSAVRAHQSVAQCEPLGVCLRRP